MKRNLPVTVWQVIQPLIDKYRPLVIPVSDKQHALTLWDSVSGTGFYFTCDTIKDSAKYRIEHVPHSVNSNTVNRQDVEVKDVGIYLDQWLQSLDAYDKLVTVYDDPILTSYQEEFFRSFAMKDEDADQAPFDFSRQIYLGEYLTSIRGLLESHKEYANEKQVIQLDEIIVECDSLSQDMTQLTKNQTVSRIAKIWALARKYGMSLIKDLLGEFKKGGMKMLVEKAFGVDADDLDTIIGMIS